MIQNKLRAATLMCTQMRLGTHLAPKLAHQVACETL